MTDKLSNEQLDNILRIYQQVSPFLSEAGKRIFLAAASQEGDYGAVSYLASHSDLSRSTINRGIDDLSSGKAAALAQEDRQRAKGAGRKKTSQKYPWLLDVVMTILDDNTYGDPTRFLSWTDLSLNGIKRILERDFNISLSPTTISGLLQELGYSRQENRKFSQVGTPHPMKNVQFGIINELVKMFADMDCPVISVDTKKKELLGNFKNEGTTYRRKGDPVLVLDHDYANLAEGKINPYGVYDINKNKGFVNVGISLDTAKFAVESIRRWWWVMGHRMYPNAKRLYITCDGGGSNGSRNRLWKYSLAKLADELGIEIWVSHFPPGNSKYNKIEHRLWNHVTNSWQAKPLYNLQVAMDLIRSTTTSVGLSVEARVDENEYEPGIKITDDMMSTVDWVYLGDRTKFNYIIRGFRDTLFDIMCEENEEN